MERRRRLHRSHQARTIIHHITLIVKEKLIDDKKKM